MKIKTHTLLIYFLPITFLFSNCNKASKNEESVDSTKIVQHHHGEEIEHIELDNGKKWVVDKNMMVHIAKMQFYVSDFEKSNDKDYHNLALKLSKCIDSLTSSCTMEGKAHDELHKWLVPFIELNEKFLKAKDIRDSEVIYAEIKSSFEEFTKYFE